MAERCPNLVRTLLALVHDERKVEDCDTDGEDHAADAFRYGLMSRPSPKPQPKASEPSDFDAAAAFKVIENRRRRLGHIGHEYEAAELYRRR
jgi:hypothetical protein